MRITADYHTHTIYSHGKGTIRENVEEAIKKGLKAIGICDHGPGHFLYGIKRDKIYQMRKEVDRLNKEYKEIDILLGVEANIIGFDGTIDVDEEVIDMLDILLLGFHYGVLFKSMGGYMFMNVVNPLSKLLPICKDKVIERNTAAIIKAIERYPVDLITHPGDKVRLNTKKVAEAAYKKGVALEINSKHNELSVENLKIALETQVEFCISSDAHRPEDVGSVDEAIDRIIKANVPLVRIKNIVGKQ